jgi:NAD-dependent DNA ligase
MRIRYMMMFLIRQILVSNYNRYGRQQLVVDRGNGGGINNVLVQSFLLTLQQQQQHHYSYVSSPITIRRLMKIYQPNTISRSTILLFQSTSSSTTISNNYVSDIPIDDMSFVSPPLSSKTTTTTVSNEYITSDTSSTTNDMVMVDSTAFLVLHYYRDKVGEDDSENRQQQERQQYYQQQQQQQQQKHDRSSSSSSSSKFNVRRSFVSHPTFRYKSTSSTRSNSKETSSNNDNNISENSNTPQLTIMDAIIERIDMNTVTKTTDINHNRNENSHEDPEKEKVYNELKSVSELLRQQDEIYYNNNIKIQQIVKKSGRKSSKSGSGSGYIQLQPYPQPMSDDEYDALVALEEQLCQQYPDVYERLQKESPYGTMVTRFNGRVGIASTSYTTDTIDSTGLSTIPGINDDTLAHSNEEELDDGITLDKLKQNEIESAAQVIQQQQQSRLKRTHLRPMLSLDNVNDKTQLFAWLERIRKKIMNAMDKDRVDLDDTVGEDDDDIVESISPVSFTIITEPKLDGVSLNIRYVLLNDLCTYQLQYATTRGDGKKGTDVTSAIVGKDGTTNIISSIPYAFQIPSTISTSTLIQYWPKEIEVRGEIILPQSIFQQLQNVSTTSLDNDDGTTGTGTTTIASFSNARNAASGILLRKDDVIGSNDDMTNDLRSKLRFYAYDIIVDPTYDIATITPVGGSIRELLRIFGFNVPQPCVSTTLTVQPNNVSNSDNDEINSNGPWTESDISNMLQYHNDLKSYRESKISDKDSTTKVTMKNQFEYDWGDYDMDGCVHKVLDESLRTLLGTSNRAPRWAVAHKFPPTIAITELIQIDVQVGRTGAITPVAILKPVDIDGVTVQRATMHNFYHMQNILCHPNRVINGTKVLVRRAGEVIPQVVSRVFPMTEAELLLLELDPSKCIPIEIPSHCPACGSVAINEYNKNNTSSSSTTVGTVTRCSGPSLLCPPRAIAALQHAFSRDALDITGLSEARIEQLIENGSLHVPSDLFDLVNNEEKVKEIAKLSGWGPKSIQNLINVVQRVAKDGVSLSRFIYSLGIRGSGAHSSALIAAVYGTIDLFLSDLNDAAIMSHSTKPDKNTLSDSTYTGFARLQEDNECTKGIGPILIAALHEYAKVDVLVDATRRLAKCIKVLPEESTASLDMKTDTTKISTGKPFSGQSVVFTGSISDLSRTEAQKLAKELGAKSTPASVSKSTGIVVSGEAGGKKLIQALKLGVRVINTEEFLKIVDDYRQSK